MKSLLLALITIGTLQKVKHNITQLCHSGDYLKIFLQRKKLIEYLVIISVQSHFVCQEGN